MGQATLFAQHLPTDVAQCQATTTRTPLFYGIEESTPNPNSKGDTIKSNFNPLNWPQHVFMFILSVILYIFAFTVDDPLRQTVDAIIANIFLVGAILSQQINNLQGTNYE